VSDDTWIVVPNWRKFQHYQDGRWPTWLKLYVELAHKPEWLALRYDDRGLLVTVWIEYALSHGRLTQRTLCGRLVDDLRTPSAQRKHLARALKRLNHAGWIELNSRPSLAQKENPKGFSLERASERPAKRSRSRAKEKPVNPAARRKVCPECEMSAPHHATDCTLAPPPRKPTLEDALTRRAMRNSDR
jgi:hypothetical protein